MGEKNKNKCLIPGVFNTFISLLLVVILLILASSMSHVDTSQRIYNFALYGSEIFRGKVDLSDTQDSGLICNGTQHVDVRETVRDKTQRKPETRTIQPELETQQFMGQNLSTNSAEKITTIEPPEAQEENNLFKTQFHAAPPPAENKAKQPAKKNRDQIQRKPETKKIQPKLKTEQFMGENQSMNSAEKFTTVESPEAQEEDHIFKAQFHAASPPAENKAKQPAKKNRDQIQRKPETKKIQPKPKQPAKKKSDSENLNETEELEQFEKYEKDSFEREIKQRSGHKNQIMNKGKKIKHFGFLKVHKAGSTTMQNIFYRFGLKNNLTFVLPIKGHYLHKPREVIPVQPGEHYDIISNHVQNFKGHFFRTFLPRDSVNIAIVREPLDRMISAAFYYRDVWNKKYLVNIPESRLIQNLIKKTDKFEEQRLSRTRNSMGLDFGFPESTKAKDKKEIKRKIGRLTKWFNLVLVMERFDESLILLKRYMNWDISDIMYLPTNSHKHKATLLSPRAVSKFKSLNFLDYIIYDTFTEILDAKIKAAGQDFKEEVECFKTVLKLAKTFCEKENKNADDLQIPASKWNRPFAFSYKECKYINMEELDFVAKLKARHLKMHKISSSILQN